MGILICCCEKAKKNCYMTCRKGRVIEPEVVYEVPQWSYKPLRRADGK